MQLETLNIATTRGKVNIETRSKLFYMGMHIWSYFKGLVNSWSFLCCIGCSFWISFNARLQDERKNVVEYDQRRESWKNALDHCVWWITVFTFICLWTVQCSTLKSHFSYLQYEFAGLNCWYFDFYRWQITIRKSSSCTCWPLSLFYR